MPDKFLCLKKDILSETNLEQSICNYIFNKSKFLFAAKMKREVLEKVFKNNDDCFDNFVNEFDVQIERVYIDLGKGELRSLVISCYGYDERIYYCLVVFNPGTKKYEMIYLSWNINSIDTKWYDENTFKQEITTAIGRIAANLGVFDVVNAFGNMFYDKRNSIFVIDESRVDSFAKDIIATKCCIELNATRVDDIKVNNLTIDLFDLDNPAVLKATVSYKEKTYECWTSDWSLEEIKEIKSGEKTASLLTPFADQAIKTFIKENTYIVEEYEKGKLKKTVKDIIVGLFSKRFTIIDNDDSIGFKEIGENIINLGKDVTIKVSRDSTITDVTNFSYQDIIDNKAIIRPVIDKYINTKPKAYIDFMKESDDVLKGNYDLETTLSKVNDLLNNKIKQIIPFDKANPQFEKTVDLLKNKRDRLYSIDKAKISKAIGLINRIKDTDTYDKYNDDLWDAVDELSDEEMSAIKNEYEKFLKDFNDVPSYLSQQTIYRRVFIRKKTLEEIKTINAAQSDLRLLNVLDEIVDQLKTIPGKDLGSYLLRKGLNFPIKEDRSIKKIRILKNAKYRLLFVYGSDLNLKDRLENADSIYIFAVTEHKKDKGELYTLAKTKPTEYQINDFILYPRNKALKIPECTSEQYKIAATSDEKPTITFGCAGSGKTTVSIEKYVNIVYSKFDCKSPKPEDLVYITFHKGLSDKVRKDLLEFKIDGNCYKLDEYFAYVVGEEYVLSKVINEIVFINWFNKAYSETEIKKNKGQKKKKIAPLSDKPDLARLLYTYYRGVFKGSKKLYDANETCLSYQTFMSEMSKEDYLSDEEKSAIYNICVEFNDYASTNGLLSDNDYALKVIRQVNYGIKRTDCIIIDEVQDLTEIELIATILTLKKDSQKIYFYGDPHQSINPNVFKTNTINMVFTELKKQGVEESEHLKTTYRTNKHLISYLNELLKNRDKWIGLFGGGLQHIDEPAQVDDDTSWAGYVTNKDLYAKIFESNPNSMIITPGEVERQQLLKKYPNVEPARAITIYDAKGMEWETIIMYNMFTSYESYFLDMISESDKAKRSTIHRMTFNKYYVGCTRSTKSFVIIEENDKLLQNHNPIFDTLLSSFAPIYREEQIDTYVFENNTFEAWYREAIQNLENDNNSTFKHAAMHARALATTEQEKKLVRDLIEGNNPETLEQYAFSFLDSGDYDLARNAFHKCFKLSKRNGPYITLAFVLEGKEPKEKYLKDLLKHKEIIDKYPEVLPKIIALPDFQNHIKTLSDKLLKQEEK